MEVRKILMIFVQIFRVVDEELIILAQDGIPGHSTMSRDHHLFNLKCINNSLTDIHFSSSPSLF